MKTPTILLALAAAPLTLTATSNAQGIYAEFYSSSNPGDGWAALPGFPSQNAGEAGLPSGSDLTIELASSQTIRVFTDDPTSTDIGVITLNAEPGLAPTLLVANTTSRTISTASPLGQIACRTLAGIRANEQTKVQINAHSISGPGIDTHRVVRLDLTGDLDAPIVHWGDLSATAPNVGSIAIAGDVTPKGSVAAYRGNIGAVTVQGDLNGHISARAGRIASIDVAGSIGSQGRPAIHAVAPFGAFAIDRVVAGNNIGRPDSLPDIITSGAVRAITANEIHANIDLENDPADPGFIALLETRTGDFSGSFRVRSLTSFGGWNQAPCSVSIAGDVLGDIIFTNVVRNENSLGPEVDITGTIAQDASIVIGSLPSTNTGLPATQIIVRSEKSLEGLIIIGNGHPEAFTSSASVQIGTQNPIIVTDPTKHYTTPFADFGGGAVAIAPFNFHQTESFPNHNETITLEGDQLLTAVAPRFFGPVFSTGGAQQMIVEHLAEGAQVWVDRSGEFLVDAPTENASGSRTIVVRAIAPASFNAGQWRLRPVDGALKSARAINTPDVAFDSEYDDDTYRFNVAGGADCPQPPGIGRSSNSEIDFADSDGVIRVNCP
ncbi:MAG: hypothetical protein ED559_00965 [Phycisphaera sp.]|nr:MAG: hypothetical protein ED559_00965 [Phycisphaera sp.]